MSDSLTQWVLYLVVGAMAGLLVTLWFKHLWESGQIWQIALYSVVGTTSIAGLSFLFWKLGFFKKMPKQEYYDPQQVATRISGAAFRLESSAVCRRERGVPARAARVSFSIRSSERTGASTTRWYAGFGGG